MKKLFIMFLIVSLGVISCKKESCENPFYCDWNTPFEVPPFDKIKFEHFKPAYLKGMEEEMAEVNTIINNTEDPTFDNTIRALQFTGELLTRVQRAMGPLSGANTNDSIQALQREMTPLFSKHRDDISLNDKLFERVKSVYENRDKFDLTPEESKLLEDEYIGFIRNGIGLSSEDKEKLRKLNGQLSMLSVRFGENLLKETNAFTLVIENEQDLSGLPEGVRAQAASAAQARGMEGKWLFTLQAPSYFPFLTYADNRSLREKMFRGYMLRGNNGNDNDNNQIVADIVRLRVERAQLLGYKSHADYVLERNMAKEPEKVLSFLSQIWDAALPVAKAEAAEQQVLIDKEGGKFKLEPWDWFYYTEKIRKEKYDLSDEETRPYFSVSNVTDGMFYVANRLYGLEFSERNDIPLYHPDVKTFEVKRNNKHVGILMIDYYPRASKRGGAWCSPMRPQRLDENGKFVTPLVSMVTNFTPPSGDKPALLTPDEASTLFHEFGHALHSLLSNTEYTSGVSRDFVELPSQIMEHWVLEPEVLRVYAKHYQTGEVIPDELIEKIEKAGKFNTGFTTVEYLAASSLDMEYHSLTEPVEVNVGEFEKSAMDKYGLIPEIIPRYRSTYFSHIFSGGYSSGYYSYIWCEVLDADAFKAFKETGDIFNKEVAARFEKEILARKGSRDELDMYISFRGREPGIEALLENRGLVKQ
ncbi:MAG: M3 family metallopeptidase [Bacteroidales bacterium]|jgi:peptidyl-dipeptidase Dcp|nr:M3 family metallopeptidase [Bacteroidales bacterium]